MRTLADIQADLDREIPAGEIMPADESRGIFGQYVKGQWAMQSANQIFGLDGIEGVDIAREPLVQSTAGDDMIVVIFVNVRFAALDDRGIKQSFSRPGCGVGQAKKPRDRGIGAQQLDTAFKSAMTDAVKNALMRTGRYLGGQLYFDERLFPSFGWEREEGASEGSAQRAAVMGVNANAGVAHMTTVQYELSELAKETMPEGGWGKDKKFGGMSLSEMYDDPRGKNALAWAAGLDDAKGINAKMGRYYKLMKDVIAEKGEQLDAEREEAERARDATITMWFGEDKPIGEFINWQNISAGNRFNEMISNKFNPDGKIANFGSAHPRFTNHLKKHFGVDSGREMTWGMLEALHLYCVSGPDSAAFAFPEYYTGARAPSDLVEEETGPTLMIGPRGQQAIPAALQGKIAKAIGRSGADADAWLWTIMRKPVGEWTKKHTALIDAILSVISDGKMAVDDHKSLMVLWDAGVTGIG